MKKTITFLLATTFAISCFAQNFEGKIIYKNSYKSKIPNVTDVLLTTMMGATQEYFIKNGDYKSITDGSLFQWQLYVNKDNKLYSKMSNNETILWNDGATNPDEIVKTEVNKGAAKILNYLCDELILTCKSGIQKYYFNTKISVDPKMFASHKFGNWYDVVSITNSLPLKSTIDNGQFYLESEATEIKEMQLEKTLFQLPENAKTMKSPY